MNEEMSDKQKFHVLCENENCRWSLAPTDAFVGCGPGTPNDCGENMPFLKADYSHWHDGALMEATDKINARVKEIMDGLGKDELNRFPALIYTRHGVMLVWGKFREVPPPDAVTYDSTDAEIAKALKLKQNELKSTTA
jgi:hypothetical protein